VIPCNFTRCFEYLDERGGRIRRSGSSYPVLKKQFHAILTLSSASSADECKDSYLLNSNGGNDHERTYQDESRLNVEDLAGLACPGKSAVANVSPARE
jgi:hypothetical protein